jgi:SDR family mycofactocin-dependent oxidoreductase
MPGLTGKVAFITGAARGQGRAHAVRLAREGCDIIAVDICADIPTMTYPNASEADLAETVALVEKEDRRIVARKADVRDFAGLKAAFEEGLAEFGRVDIVIANAGIIRLGDEEDLLAEWNDVIDTNLNGVYHTIRVALPAMREAGRGGSIVITSSSAGLRSSPADQASGLAYMASKRAVVGLAQSLAGGLAKEWIRVNTIHPTGVMSGMTMNEAMARQFEQAAASGDNMIAGMQNALPIEMLQPEDIANAVAFLVSEEAKFITGIAWPLDAGFTVR